MTDNFWGKCFKSCFLANVILFFGLIISDRLYIDDIGRSLSGYFLWTSVGRPLADAVIYLLNLGSPLVNMGPLPQLVSIVVIATTCVVLAKEFNIKKPWWVAICTLPIAGQPYYLQNMSYSFDSPAMAIALCFAVLSAHFLFKETKFKVLIPFLLLATFCLYQAAFSAYLVATTLLLINHINPKTPLTYLVRKAGAFLITTLPGCAAYWVIMQYIKYSPYAEKYNKFIPITTMPDMLITNTMKYLYVFANDWEGNAIGYVMAAILIIGLFSYCINIFASNPEVPISAKALCSGLAMLLFLGAVIFSYLPQTLMTNLQLAPRTFLGVGILLSMSCLQTASLADGRISSKLLYRVGIVPAVVLGYSLLVFSYTYAKANASQKAFEHDFLNRLMLDIDPLIVKNQVDSLGFVGAIPKSPVVAHATLKYPLLNSLVPSHINGNRPHGHRLLKTMGLSLTAIEVKEADVAELAVSSKPTVSRKDYDLYLRDHQAVIKISNLGQFPNILPEMR